MISPYFVIVFVFGIVLCYLWLIHRLWLRSIFREGQTRTLDAKIREDVGNLSGSNLGSLAQGGVPRFKAAGIRHGSPSPLRNSLC
jgi:hypothetical protein